MNSNKIWFITGASKGLGLTLAKTLLDKGYKVAATSRNIKDLTHNISSLSENFLPLEMNIIDENSVKISIEAAIEHFTTIDVVVNNAGYGQVGTLEELTDEEVKRNFNVNVFGLLNVVRNTMAHFRKKGSGHIFNISSIGGYNADFAGWGAYCATKFAVAGLTESLAAEAKEFGIKTTLVYPGYFRTDFLSGSSLQTPEKPIVAYAEARQSEAFHQNEINGNQQGDPVKAALVLIEQSEENNPALHLFLGQDAFDFAHKKIEAVEADLMTWKKQTLSTALN